MSTSSSDEWWVRISWIKTTKKYIKVYEIECNFGMIFLIVYFSWITLIKTLHVSFGLSSCYFLLNLFSCPSSCIGSLSWLHDTDTGLVYLFLSSLFDPKPVTTLSSVFFSIPTPVQESDDIDVRHEISFLDWIWTSPLDLYLISCISSILKNDYFIIIWYICLFFISKWTTSQLLDFLFPDNVSDVSSLLVFLANRQRRVEDTMSIMRMKSIFSPWRVRMDCFDVRVMSAILSTKIFPSELTASEIALDESQTSLLVSETRSLDTRSRDNSHTSWGVHSRCNSGILPSDDNSDSSVLATQRTVSSRLDSNISQQKTKTTRTRRRTKPTDRRRVTLKRNVPNTWPKINGSRTMYSRWN